LPAALIVYAAVSQLRTCWNAEAKPSAVLALVGILACAALQQFALAAGLLIIFTLLGVLDGRKLCSASYRPLQAALIACLLFWTAFALATQDWHAPGLSPLHRDFLLGYEFVRFPDAVRQIAMPWARTVPGLGLGLFVLAAACCLRAIARFEETALHERVLLALFVILLMAASASNPPRNETRYVFFLYPLAVLFSILTIRRVVAAMMGPTRLAAVAGSMLCIFAFVASEDFRPWHLLNIDTEAVNFRIGMPGRLAGHYHPRSDVRSAAMWLHDHTVPGQDLVMISFPGVDFYYRQADYYFVADTDPRFEAWSCRRGTTQRWSNLPMIHSYDTLVAKSSGRRVWLVLERARMPETLARFPAAVWTLAWSSHSGDIVIVSLHEPPPAVSSSAAETPQ
jgi:hypothetical protein